MPDQAHVDSRTFPGRLTEFAATSKGAEMGFSDCTPEEVAAALQRFFQDGGFRLESGTTHEAVYGMGSKTARAFAGAFTKRAKYNVRVVPTDRGVAAIIASGMSGASGSLVGIAKEQSQRKRVAADLHTFFSSLTDGD